MVLVAVAAWQRSKAQARAASDAHASILISACFATVALLLLTSDHFHPVGDVALALESVAVALAIARLLLTYRDHVRLLKITHAEALTDALTHLGNRRRLLLDLEEAVSSDESYVLGILDLDGFKAYNDTFGHLAGDSLLQRFAAKLAEIPDARPYRLGGDEFCVLAQASASSALDLISAATAALVVEGDGFAVAASHGAVLIPEDAATTEEALRLADQRMYEQKTGRAPIGRRPAWPCSRRWRSSTTDWPAMPRTSASWRSPSAGGSGSTRTSSPTCGSLRTCTTSARSRSPTTSCTSPACSTRRSGASSAATR
jgi:diguanylate cyclase (GGDEF)-like protein